MWRIKIDFGIRNEEINDYTTILSNSYDLQPYLYLENTILEFNSRNFTANLNERRQGS